MMSRINTVVSVLKAHRREVYRFLAIAYICLLLIIIFTKSQSKHALPQEDITSRLLTTTQPLFPIQCIDTMKISRDRAREPLTPEKRQLIKRQVQEIAAIGANCIAVGTPYNDEFLPYLRIFVQEARQKHLHVWFRGNFAEWEGWFGYKQKMSTSDHIKKTTEFIENNPDLFEDGDLFTATPEVENGGPFKVVNSQDKIDALRRFLRDEQETVMTSFKIIGKDVHPNFVSMSGGVAKYALDSETVKSLKNTVTIDHYVSKPEEIDEYIRLFHTKYNATVAFGEFGAPIPDLNGIQNEDQQAAFVSELLAHIYAHSDIVHVVNYWTLSESSTALLTYNGQEKEVVNELKKYYKPAVIKGIIRDNNGKGIPSITVRTKDNVKVTRTSADGAFQFVVPAIPTHIEVLENEKYTGTKIHLQPHQSTEYTVTITLQNQQLPLIYRLKKLIGLK